MCLQFQDSGSTWLLKDLSLFLGWYQKTSSTIFSGLSIAGAMREELSELRAEGQPPAASPVRWPFTDAGYDYHVG